MKNAQVNHEQKVGEVNLVGKLTAEKVNEIGSDTLKMLNQLSQETDEVKILANFDKSVEFTIDGTVSAVKWMKIVSFDRLVMVMMSDKHRSTLEKITKLSGKSDIVKFANSKREALKFLDS